MKNIKEKIHNEINVAFLDIPVLVSWQMPTLAFTMDTSKIQTIDYELFQIIKEKQSECVD